jgi:uncharacterized membrane protein YoaK (UPF0700 family)
MFSYYDKLYELLEYSYTGFVLGLVPTLLMTVLFYLSLRLLRHAPKDASVPSAFTAFGTVCGIMVGASREPVISAAFPLVFAMVTLFITFVVEKKDQDEIRRMYMLSLLGFFFGIIFGAFYGAKVRQADLLQYESASH